MSIDERRRARRAEPKRRDAKRGPHGRAWPEIAASIAARRAKRKLVSDERRGRGGATTPEPTIVAVDLFCGAGGLTHGMERVGIDVRLGVDLDRRCAYPYSENNTAAFRAASVSDLEGRDLRAVFADHPYRLLAGCAPCQPFSTYRQGRKASDDDRWNLLSEFGRLVVEADANLVTMENVPRLVGESVFDDFVRLLRREGFSVAYDVVECVRFGIPQARRRLVLLASKFGPVELSPPSSIGFSSVREAISDLRPLVAGGRDDDDPIHASPILSPTNLARIRASRPGGTWRDWPPDLVAKCHLRPTGRTYPGVYGRMTWDDPAPTITTQYYGFGSGRFGHPDQDRALSLREGAILQSFPRDYRFVEPGKPVETAVIGRLIGNAVPVRLGEAIGESLLRHVRDVATR